MDEKWKFRKNSAAFKYLLYYAIITMQWSEVKCESYWDRQLRQYIDSVLSIDNYSIIPGVDVGKAQNASTIQPPPETGNNTEDYFWRKVNDYAENHVVSVNIPATARFFQGTNTTGRNSFLTGFGMGFIAFALKKLLLPVFIGAQLVKSVLIAMFLPTLLGGVGKLVGKGLSTFSGISGASAGMNNNNQQIEDFEFKDTDPYSNDIQDFNTDSGDTLSLNVAGSTPASVLNANSRFGFGNHRIYPMQSSENYYMRKPNKKADYKVFHKIPSSSLLLTSYDPFYSPLLSRLDAVFQQLGFGDDKSPDVEKCRERLVCMMYANPAKYAPYSNLVSAQLSRELNELRKPSSDNPDILRFFRYMKAAKDGQDGEECLAHKGCNALTSNQASPAILTTFNEINKLVQARKLN